MDLKWLSSFIANQPQYTRCSLDKIVIFVIYFDNIENTLCKRLVHYSSYNLNSRKWAWIILQKWMVCDWMQPLFKKNFFSRFCHAKVLSHFASNVTLSNLLTRFTCLPVEWRTINWRVQVVYPSEFRKYFQIAGKKKLRKSRPPFHATQQSLLACFVVISGTMNCMTVAITTGSYFRAILRFQKVKHWTRNSCRNYSHITSATHC